LATFLLAKIDWRSGLDGLMPRSAQPDDGADDWADDRASSVDGLDTVGDSPRDSGALDEAELDSALQLLVERAQYITGSTGAALALPQGDEMVCRASAGGSAPAVGARLQVRSGLTAESIARRQLLRCNNAEADPRVNLEVCRALGIASIVVLPLLHRTGEVRGLFELFSDHPYAFEERDLIALERMADLTLTALDLAEQSAGLAPRREQVQGAVQSPAPSPEFFPVSGAELSATNDTLGGEAGEEPTEEEQTPATPLQSETADQQLTEMVAVPSAVIAPPIAAASEATHQVQKCASCGFPVSEGRILCLDCEKKDAETKPDERELRMQDASGESASPPSSSSDLAPAPDEFVPAFLANSASVKGSWMSNHVNLLAIVVLILGVLVAVVIFR
jgi:hypothetical protein